MNPGVYVVIQSALLFVDVITLAMFARMIVGWFTMGEETKLSSFLYVATEPVILPVRALCDRLGLFRGLPFDMPFFLTSLLLMVVSIVLQVFITV